MATVLEECTTEEHRSVIRFLWTKGLNVKVIHKEMFTAYGGKCSPRKAVHNWVKKFSEGCSKVADDVRPGHPVEIATGGTTMQRLLCCGFRRTDKAMG
jgi:hypothetical protein